MIFIIKNEADLAMIFDQKNIKGFLPFPIRGKVVVVINTSGVVVKN